MTLVRLCISQFEFLTAILVNPIFLIYFPAPITSADRDGLRKFLPMNNNLIIFSYNNFIIPLTLHAPVPLYAIFAENVFPCYLGDNNVSIRDRDDLMFWCWIFLGEHFELRNFLRDVPWIDIFRYIVNYTDKEIANGLRLLLVVSYLVIVVAETATFIMVLLLMLYSLTE